ncbi:MAG: DUF4393 domain-containing protein [Achromobacter sp.]
MRSTGLILARSARTIAETIDICLMPLAAINFGYLKGRTYFEEKFPRRLEERTADIPSASVQDPAPAVAAQALQGLTFAHEEPSLEDMYLHLLATSMDGRLPQDAAHPAFVEVIRQMTALEATLVKDVFLKYEMQPIVQLRKKITLRNSPRNGSHTVALRYLFDLRSEGAAVEVDGFGAMIDNLIRLGLIVVNYDRQMTAPGAYSWADSRPETERLRKGCDSSFESIEVRPGTMEPTEFGYRFARAVGIQPHSL